MMLYSGRRESGKKGYSLIELVFATLIIGLLAAVCIPRFVNGIRDDACARVTDYEMSEIVNAIIGDTSMGFRGYRTDMARWPGALADLLVNPNIAGLQTFNPVTQSGWNGPYLDANDGDNSGTADVLEDGWLNDYVYVAPGAPGSLTSLGPNGAAGGGDDIVINIE